MVPESDELKEIINDFIIESEEIIENLDQKLLNLEKDSSNNTLNSIFRGFHTIKGTSGFLGFQKLSSLTHTAENLLNYLRRGELSVNSEIIDVLLEVMDILRLMISNIKEEGNEGEVENYEDVISRLQAFQPLGVSGQQEKQSEEKRAEEEKKIEVKEDEDKKEQEDIVFEKKKDISDEDKKLGQLLIQEGLASEDDIDEALKKQEEGLKLGEILVQNKVLTKEQLDNVLKKQKPKPEKPEQVIRVEVSRLDNLMNLVGELVLGKNRLVQIYKKMETVCSDDKAIDALNETIMRLGSIASNLQESIMKTRMLPLQRAIGKFPRIIRSLKKTTKKDFELRIFGEDTELDKSIIEEIGDPLVHLIRNAVDHGIEYPEERIAAGKPPKGLIILKAFHEGNNIIIEIKDDGKGIDIEKIKEKAIKKNLVSRKKAEMMPKDDILNFIFYPGFSTADVVTEISGRGVGMDVVKENITKLKGIIEIDTEKGKGTTFRIKLPLTLAIIQSLIVDVAGEIFAIPLPSVVETVRINYNEIYEIEDKKIINIRNSIIPLIDLKEVFNLNSNENEYSDDRVYIVIIGVAEKRKGLIVSRLLGQQEIVIKNLGKYLDDTEGFSGCTIMGDGKLTLIIDVDKFFEEKQDINYDSLMANV